jgi:hypothetical protein
VTSLRGAIAVVLESDGYATLQAATVDEFLVVQGTCAALEGQN